MDTICATLKDYFEDYQFLKPKNFKMVIEEAQVLFAHFLKFYNPTFYRLFFFFLLFYLYFSVLIDSITFLFASHVFLFFNNSFLYSIAGPSSEEVHHFHVAKQRSQVNAKAT